MTRPDPWSEPREGFHFEVVADAGWVTPPAETKAEPRCRFLVGGRACGEAAVASLNRSTGPRPRWWHYCEKHLYGRWIEDGQVVHWRLVRDAE